jgi:uncharacterized delta-60 repeat protein
MWHKNRSLTILADLLLCLTLVFSFAPASLALEPQAEETEVYLPLVLRRHLYKEPSGVLDPSFSGDGMALANFGAGSTEIYAMVVQSDGKIISAGVFFGLSQDFVVIRYNPDGSLDPTFSDDGWLLTDFGGGETARALALQSDGKIIAAGDMSHNAFVMARYNPDGSLDTAFDGDGKVLTDLAGQDEIKAVAVQNDGKIVVAGRNFNDIAVARYNPDGSLDTSFDEDGIVVTGIASVYGDLDDGRAIALQLDGKILVTGYTENNTDDIVVVRYNADGSLDTAFSDDGIQTTDLGFHDDTGNAIKVQQDGKIVVAGSTGSASVQNFALVRYNADGSLDTTFSGDGLVSTDFAGGTDRGYAMVLQGDGKIFVAGYATSTSGVDFAAARYTADGSLDPTFDTDGKALVDFNAEFEYGLSAALQADGKLLVAGLIGIDIRAAALARFNPDGSLDSAFSGDGKLLTQVAGSEDVANAMALQPDGKLVVAGFSDRGAWDFALARFNPDGSLDNTFSGDGIVITQFGSDDSTIEALALQADGKIIAAGYVEGFTTDFALARYNPDGTLDTSFDGDGWLTTDFAFGDDTARAVRLQADGKIVVAGHAYNSSNDFALARYNANGSLDTAFDGDGKLTTDFGGGTDLAFALALQADGKIVAAGEATVTSNIDFALARYNANGSLDTTFSSDGKLATDFSADYDHGSAVAIQADGKIIVAGYAYGAAMFDFALARYNPNGDLDTTFDSDGKLVTDFAGDMDLAAAIALQPNGKIVVVGNAFSTSSDFALARYNPDGSLDLTFADDGLLMTDNAGIDDYAKGIVLQPNGEIVIAGFTGNRTDYDFAVLRYK